MFDCVVLFDILTGGKQSNRRIKHQYFFELSVSSHITLVNKHQIRQLVT